MTVSDPINGAFQYPPNGNVLAFNFLDTVNVTWEAGQENSTACYLSLWYWPTFNPWQISYNQTVPCNGSQLVGLNVATQWYLGQFNLNYTRSDGDNGLYLSEIFHVDNDRSSTPVIWSLQNPTAASSSASHGLPGTTTSVLVHEIPTSTSRPSLDSSSQLVPSSSLYSILSSSPISSSPPISLPLPSADESSSLNPGQVAGISVGAVLVTLLALALVGVLWLKRKRQRATTKGSSHARLPEPDTKHIPFIGNTANSNENELLGPQWRELDGQERRVQLHGDGERWELNGETAENTQTRKG